MRRERWLDDARSEALAVAQKYVEIDRDLGMDLWDRIEHRLPSYSAFRTPVSSSKKSPD
jgi:hypothetical protein